MGLEVSAPRLRRQSNKTGLRMESASSLKPIRSTHSPRVLANL
jgi:hypothetical protein